MTINKKLFNKILIISFGVFGLAALIYQVAFAKNLILLFGLTAPAISTVLAVYFSGLALGSFIFGKIADRLTQNFKHFYLYIGLLIGAGIYGFFVPWFFQFLGKIIQWINQIYPLSFSGFNFFAFLLSFLFLIIPAVLIGGGFPVISKIFIKESETLGKKISLLYFINTFGSVLGALLAGFWLIPLIGVKMTIFSASILSLIMGLFLICFVKKARIKENQLESKKEKTKEIALQTKEKKETNTLKTLFGNNLFVYVLFLTGFLALALEVFYTKTLILFLGSSTYAFSLVLIVFLLGLALGSLIISRFLDRIKRGYFVFGIFSGFLGFWLFVTLKIFEQLPFFYLKILQWFYNPQFFEEPNFHLIIFAQILILFLIIFPASLLMGMIFPLGVKLANPDSQKIGEGIGRLYFANTLGGVLGSLAVGFLFLPNLGFQKTLILLLSVYFLLAIFFLIKEKLANNLLKNILVSLFVGLFIFSIFTSPWSKEYLLSGVFSRASFYLRESEEETKEYLKSLKILFYKEGLSQVAVIEEADGGMLLLVNGRIEASTNVDMETQILTGALPLVLHSNPEEVLVIGLGSGMTLGAVTQFKEVEKITSVEINPAVVSAAEYFKNWNNNALADPRVKMVAADARNYLYLTEKKYDVISSGPSNVWASGTSYLFTKEYYQLAKERLKEDGLMLQWVQYYGIWPQDLKVILRTFQESFPQVYVFESFLTADLLLVGAKDENMVLDFDAVEKTMADPQIKQELKRILINDSVELMGRLVGTSESIKEVAADADIHGDDRPFLEFSAPQAIYQNTFIDNWQILLDMREKTKQIEQVSDYALFRYNWLLAEFNLLKGNMEKTESFLIKAQKTGHSHPAFEEFVKYFFKPIN